MSTSYKALMQERTQTLGKMHKSMPEIMKAFGGLSAAVGTAGALDQKTKELIELALAVANHCQGCIAFHTAACIKHGASREEVMDTLGLAIYMGGGPSLMYAAEAVDAFDEMSA